MIAPAVGYRVEGVADGPSTVIKVPVDGILNGVFNLEGDNDKRYYEDNFMSKRMQIPVPFDCTYIVNFILIQRT